MKTELTHIDENGKIKMVDVSDKNISLRKCSAVCEVLTLPETTDILLAEKIKKGDALAAAKIAGIMAAKNTASLIPLCHNIPLSNIDIKIEILTGKIKIFAAVTACSGTGAEMEALTAAATAALTLYDMLKAIDKNIMITGLTLDSKSGGKTRVLSGKIVSINVSAKKGCVKNPVNKCRMIANLGIKEDAHAAEDSIRQVSFLSLSSFEKAKAKKEDLKFGDFAENIDIEGVDVWKLPIGARIEFLSGIILEVTKIGKECHNPCIISKITGDCVMPREGIFCRVVNGGDLTKGDICKVVIYENINTDNK